MSSFSNSPLYPRYHNPELPIVRTALQNIVIFLTQFCLTVAIYWATYWVAGGIGQAHEILRNPNKLLDLPFELWLSLICFIFLMKVFNPIPTLLGGIFAEYLIEFNYNGEISWILIGYIAWVGVFQIALHYKGGDFYQGSKLIREMVLTLIQIVSFLPLLYYFAPFSPNLEQIFLNQGKNLRGYYLIYFLINQIVVFIIPSILVWLMDRALTPYFPLTTEEQQLYNSSLQTSKPNSDLKLEDEGDSSNELNGVSEEMDDIAYDDLIPKPGELYSEILSHHSLIEDNHTIVLILGKVRIYLCTRCAAMILGVVISGTLFWILSEILQWYISARIALWLIFLLPIIPLTDWGLQALHIRPATTPSRLVTGFILGICLNMILFAQGFEQWIFLAMIVYFSIFGVLYYFRSREKIEKNI